MKDRRRRRLEREHLPGIAIGTFTTKVGAEAAGDTWLAEAVHRAKERQGFVDRLLHPPVRKIDVYYRDIGSDVRSVTCYRHWWHRLLDWIEGAWSLGKDWR